LGLRYLMPEQFVTFQLREHFDHPVVAPFVELSDYVSANVRLERQEPEQVATSADGKIS
jgi:hypothetical protein